MKIQGKKRIPLMTGRLFWLMLSAFLPLQANSSSGYWKRTSPLPIFRPGGKQRPALHLFYMKSTMYGLDEVKCQPGRHDDEYKTDDWQWVWTANYLLFITSSEDWACSMLFPKRLSLVQQCQGPHRSINLTYALSH